MMKKKLGLALVLLALFPSLAQAQRRPALPDPNSRATEWAPVDKSLTALLDEGWKIISFNDYQTEMFSQNVSAYTFILSNGGKYILCFIENPEINNANSKCRALN